MASRWEFASSFNAADYGTGRVENLKQLGAICLPYSINVLHYAATFRRFKLHPGTLNIVFISHTHALHWGNAKVESVAGKL